jgi:hypothetical protein
MLRLHICYWHGANATNFLIMKSNYFNLRKAIMVPAGVQLATRQNFCIPHLRLSKCYNSTALNWYQASSEWNYRISARKIRQLWFWCSQRPELRWLPRMDMGNPPVRTPFDSASPAVPHNMEHERGFCLCPCQEQYKARMHIAIPSHYDREIMIGTALNKQIHCHILSVDNKKNRDRTNWLQIVGIEVLNCLEARHVQGWTADLHCSDWHCTAMPAASCAASCAPMHATLGHARPRQAMQ